VSEFQEWYASLPEWREVTHFASYGAKPAHWERIAVQFEENGEKRLAQTIRKGVDRQTRPNHWAGSNYEITLRFRDGSIEKVRNAFIAYEEEKAK
jgi:hypothetical protein